MANYSFSKESLEGKPAAPDALYEVRLEGFEPKTAKAGTSINLNPILKIVNSPTHNGVRLYDNLNTGAAWIVEAFVHAFGLQLEPDGQGGFKMPGELSLEAPYQGPLLGAVAKVFTKQTEYNGRMSAKADQWVCSVPSCTKKHPSNLAK